MQLHGHRQAGRLLLVRRARQRRVLDREGNPRRLVRGLVPRKHRVQYIQQTNAPGLSPASHPHDAAVRHGLAAGCSNVGHRPRQAPDPHHRHGQGCGPAGDGAHAGQPAHQHEPGGRGGQLHAHHQGHGALLLSHPVRYVPGGHPFSSGHRNTGAHCWGSSYGLSLRGLLQLAGLPHRHGLQHHLPEQERAQQEAHAQEGRHGQHQHVQPHHHRLLHHTAALLSGGGGVEAHTSSAAGRGRCGPQRRDPAGADRRPVLPQLPAGLVHDPVASVPSHALHRELRQARGRHHRRRHLLQQPRQRSERCGHRRGPGGSVRVRAGQAAAAQGQGGGVRCQVGQGGGVHRAGPDHRRALGMRRAQTPPQEPSAPQRMQYSVYHTPYWGPLQGSGSWRCRPVERNTVPASTMCIFDAIPIRLTWHLHISAGQHSTLPRPTFQCVPYNMCDVE